MKPLIRDIETLMNEEQQQLDEYRHNRVEYFMKLARFKYIFVHLVIYVSFYRWSRSFASMLLSGL